MAENNRNIQITIKASAELTALAKSQQMLEKLASIGAPVQKSLEKVNARIEKLGLSADRVNNAFKTFRFEWLGIMFAGMALERAFNRITSTATDTFRKITESGMGFGSALTAISAEAQFMQFALGEAINTTLEPMLPLIDSLNVGISDFVEQNQTLVGAGLLFGQAAATIVTWLGQIGLAWIAIEKAFPSGAAAISSSMSRLVGAINPFVLAIGGAWFLYTTNLLNFRDITHATAKQIRDVFDMMANFVIGRINAVISAIENAVRLISNFIFGIPMSVLGGLNILPKLKLPTFQSGGVMPHTGLAMLHAGETVVPAGNTTNFGGGVTIVNNFSGTGDSRALAKEVSEQIAAQIRNVAIPTTRFG